MPAGSLFGAALALVTSYLTGRLLWRTGEWPLQFALGAAALGHVVFALGWLGWLSAWAFLAVAAVLCAASLWRSGRPAFEARPRWTWLLAVPLGAYLFLHANGPAVQPDEITYHLGLVREWLREGRFPARVGFYESMPQLAEMLFAFAYAFGGAAAAKLVHLGFLGALAALMARMAGGGAAAVLVAASPVVMITAASAYNDVMLAFYGLCLYRAVERSEYGRAGLLAGAAYAVKMTGGVFAAGALAWVLARRGRWARFAAAALVFPAPWLVRNALLAGNPFAPLMNAWFPNEHFHVSTEAALRQYLATYDVHGIDRLLHLLLGGGVLGGHIGAGFVFAPLALWALRRRETRALAVAAVVAALPWLANAGTRFLIPSLPFVALSLPPQLAWPAAILQVATLAWTPPPGSWRLEGWPARQSMPEAGVADMLAFATRPGDRVLDLVAAPMAYMDSLPLAPWGHVAADRAAAALTLAHTAAPGLLYELRADWQPVRVRTLRLVLAEAGPQPLRVQEIRLAGAERCVFRATRHTTETPLAFDRNPVTGWSTWARPRAGDGITVECAGGIETNGVRATLALVWQGMKLRVEGDGRVLNAGPSYTPLPPLNWRRAAVSAVRREGFRWILVRDTSEGYGALGADFVARTGDWGLEMRARAGNVCLWRVP